MKDREKIKPCPFCGGIPEPVEYFNGPGNIAWKIDHECFEGTDGYPEIFITAWSLGDLERLWNRRHLESELTRLSSRVEELEKGNREAVELLEEAKCLFEDIYIGEYKVDSLTAQPYVSFLNSIKEGD